MTVRVLMIGAGGVAQRHVEVLHGLPDPYAARVVGVVDPLAASAEGLAARCGAEPHSDVLVALESTRPDAVYVCVPPFAHGAPEEAALDRGLPLFVEKPVHLDVGAAEDIERRVRETGTVTGTGYHWRCLDVIPRVEDLLAECPPLAAAGYWHDKRPPVAWWPYSAQSGGQVIEQLTHVLDLSRMLLGEPEEVHAVGARVADGDPTRGDIDDATAVSVRFTSGAVATFSATSLLAARRRAALHLLCPGMVVELAETALVIDRGSEREEHPVVRDPRVTVDQEFVEAVLGVRERTRAPYEEAVATLRFGAAIARSAREHRPVFLTEQRVGGDS
jgi:predicted dehydrogenase